MRARRDTQSTAQGLEQIEKIWAEHESLDNLRLFLDQPLHIIMLNPAMGVRLHEKMLHRKLLPSRPSHHCFRNLNTLLIRKRDRERERFP